jgi:ATP-dependent Clp protease ATP-binding subunit ClpA
VPPSVNIDLPLILSPRGGLVLVRPLGFPELAVASASESSAIAAVRRRLLKRCSSWDGAELVRALVRGDVAQQTVRVAIAPETRSSVWHEAIEVPFDVFVWQQGEAIVVAYVPALDLTVVAAQQTDLEKLVGQQIRSTIRRSGQWSLASLARLYPTDGMSLRLQRLPLSLPTAQQHARRHEEQPKSRTPTLRAVATRLRRKSLRPAYDREQEVDQLARLLSAQPPRSVLLVGPSGVGKTAIFQQWVRQRGQFQYDAAMACVACWSTDGSRLISGQCGFGMWQQQCLRMADEARRYPSVVHLGNLVELCESGRLRGSGGCGALLAPRLAEGSLRAVIECTPEQLTRIQRVEPRLVQALTVLRIDEPTPPQAQSILLAAAAAWQPREIRAQRRRPPRARGSGQSRRRAAKRTALALPSPAVLPEALQLLDRLHRRFRTDAASPGRPLAFFHAVMSELDPKQALDVPRVIEAFGQQTGLPRFLIDDAVRPDLESIRQQLRAQVIGQDAVIETLVDVIATLATDLSRGDRPLASMMLVGPTGVGKTETAKALARLIYSDAARLIRIDMSELSTASAVGRLVGDALHPEGLLTSAVRAQPFSLVLLDEFEKAHPAAFDLLLQVLGEGRLTDARGRLADFRNSIVLMTSNLGVDTFRSMPLGLADTQQQQRYHSHFERQLREFLRPELFNRLDRILTYLPLDQATVQQIARLRLEELLRRDGWQSYGESLDVDAAALQVLTQSGYQPQFGARPLTREIERQLVVPLAEAICAAGRLTRLSVNVTAGAADDGAPGPGDSEAAGRPDRLQFHVISDSSRLPRADESVGGLLETMTMLRRRAQSLDRCEMLRRLRNEFTLLDRKLKTMRKTATNEDERRKIRFGPVGLERLRVRKRLRRVREMCAQIEAAEAKLMTRYYRGETIEPQATRREAESLRGGLWDLLCELLSQSGTEDQRITLVITGASLVPATALLQAYRRIALVRLWSLMVHALLRGDPGEPHDGVIDCPGWADQAAFRIACERERHKTEPDDALADPPGHRSLSAYRLVRPDAIGSPPQATLGLMLTFRGKNAALMMGGEVGVHTFHRHFQGANSGHTLLIDQHRGRPIEYIAPAWLLRREYQVSGQPRRRYDLDNDLVQDLGENGHRPLKMDREGQWLEPLVEYETEQRVWAELDMPDPSGPQD